MKDPSQYGMDRFLEDPWYGATQLDIPSLSSVGALRKIGLCKMKQRYSLVKDKGCDHSEISSGYHILDNWLQNVNRNTRKLLNMHGGFANYWIATYI